jgi:hypothetical protein
MRTIFRVMQEVKAREGEHDIIKGLALAIEGLASPSSLARRERRLLIRGSCRLLVSRYRARSQRNPDGNPQSLVPLDAINNWDGTKRSEKRRSSVPASSPDVHSGGSASGYDLGFSLVEVLVFSDVVVVITPTGKDRWKLVEGFGISRILNVAERNVAIQGEI